MVKLSSTTIFRLLTRRHSEDVFVGECKDGPTQGYSVGILDAWAMKKSWANPCFIGYEIKVDRQDFLRDNKWQRYLPSCNELYFACPTGLIRPEEVPADCGLLWLSKNGAMLITKKKAPYRKIEPPVNLFLYLLMNRMKVTTDTSDKVAFWRDFVEQRRDWHHVGHCVAKRIRELYEQDVICERKRLSDMDAALQGYERITALLKRLDINPASWDAEHQVTRKLQADHELIKAIQWLKEQLREFEKTIKAEPA